MRRFRIDPHVSAALAVFALGAISRPGEAQVAARSATTVFAQRVERLSERGGYFDSDNLISNETSYLHVMTRLEALGVRGGAYIGVGPDQNYSYLAAIRPQVAYMLDIRRDNALQHLLFKALFSRSRNRLEYLCRWLGRPVPGDVEQWTGRPILSLLARLDSIRPDPAWSARERRETLEAVTAFGVPLSARDRDVIQRFHADFMRSGLELRFSSFGRMNAGDYPTLRRLILERDLTGRMRSYLADEAAWRVVRDLHAADAIIPVVGDLAGTHAMRAIGQEVREQRLPVSALYTSNAELYVYRAQGFAAFARSVAALPVTDSSVIIRSHFDRGGQGHPLAVPGHVSIQLLQRIVDFNRRVQRGEIRTFRDVIELDAR